MLKMSTVSKSTRGRKPGNPDVLIHGKRIDTMQYRLQVRLKGQPAFQRLNTELAEHARHQLSNIKGELYDATVAFIRLSPLLNDWRGFITRNAKNFMPTAYLHQAEQDLEILRGVFVLCERARAFNESLIDANCEVVASLHEINLICKRLLPNALELEFLEHCLEQSRRSNDLGYINMTREAKLAHVLQLENIQCKLCVVRRRFADEADKAIHDINQFATGDAKIWHADNVALSGFSAFISDFPQRA